MRSTFSSTPPSLPPFEWQRSGSQAESLHTANNRLLPQEPLHAEPEHVDVAAGRNDRSSATAERFARLHTARTHVTAGSGHHDAKRGLNSARLNAVERLLRGTTPSFPIGSNAAFRELRNMIESQPTPPDPAIVDHRLTEFVARHLAPDNARQVRSFSWRSLTCRASGVPDKAARQKAHKLIKKAMVDHLNDQPWNTIIETFPHEKQWYTSRMTPAAQIKLGERCIFPNDYAGKGVSSGSSDRTDHAVNLWMSEFTASAHLLDTPIVDEQPTSLFRGIRHGILSPYGLSDAAERREGAVDRAREVVAAALYLKLSPKDLQQAMDTGKPVALKLASSSLVTAMDWGKNTEGSQLEDQMHAWRQLAGAGPLQLTLHDKHGQPRPVTVDLQVAAFNFGVNEFALDFGAGTKASDRYNREAMLRLCGSSDMGSETPGGWVGEYLAGDPPNADRVRHLYRQMREIWQNKSHRKDGGEPYKLPARIALLCNEIGIVPCYNCKSGKDRTAWLDQEIKFGAVALHTEGWLRQPGSSLGAEQRQLFGSISKHSGNFRIQQQNTGAGGNKVIKGRSAQVPTKLSLSERLPDEKAVSATRGLSKYVSA